ncbi:E3 ubiquitin-protein ligase TRIM33 isoform X2 [Myripristis murdjan]|uniref:Transcription intermediary factor 1-alpha-like n=1 Tax=Myripristis murdjan TaxID=586833 RepID=A0A667ZI08_9TELE|nr:E3 ubiquitin-protein ligase TRIM33-like isoform X2 [Myripristis murdjan]
MSDCAAPRPAEQQAAGSGGADVTCCSCGGLPSSGWCVECAEALCAECVSAHRRVKMTRAHRIQSRAPPDADVRSSGEVPPPVSRLCQIHPREPLQLFCFPCGQLTCRDCQLMAHRNHRYQFVHEALASQKQHLDSLMELLKGQRDTAHRTLQDLDTRLKDIDAHQNKLGEAVHRLFTVLVQDLKQRLLHLIQNVTKSYKVEIDLIERRRAALRRLQEKQQLLHQEAERARSSSDLAGLLTFRAQVEPQLKELLSKNISLPQKMIDIRLVVTTETYKSLFSFVDLRVSSVPFSRSQDRPQNSVCSTLSKNTAVRNQKTTALDLACTSSITPQTPSGAPQTPSGAPQTSSGTPQTPSGTPQTPSGVPQTSSSTPQIPSGAPQSPSIAPQTPSGAPYTFSSAPRTPSGARHTFSSAPQSASSAPQIPSGGPPTFSSVLQFASGTLQSSSGAPRTPSGTPQTPSGARHTFSSVPQSASSAPQIPSCGPPTFSSVLQFASGTLQSSSGAPRTHSGTPQTPSGAPHTFSSAPQSASSAPQIPSGAPHTFSGAPQSASSAPQIPSGAPHAFTSAPQTPSSALQTPSACLGPSLSDLFPKLGKASNPPTPVSSVPGSQQSLCTPISSCLDLHQTHSPGTRTSSAPDTGVPPASTAQASLSTMTKPNQLSASQPYILQPTCLLLNSAQTASTSQAYVQSNYTQGTMPTAIPLQPSLVTNPLLWVSAVQNQHQALSVALRTQSQSSAVLLSNTQSIMYNTSFTSPNAAVLQHAMPSNKSQTGSVSVNQSQPGQAFVSHLQPSGVQSNTEISHIQPSAVTVYNVPQKVQVTVAQAVQSAGVELQQQLNTNNSNLPAVPEKCQTNPCQSSAGQHIKPPSNPEQTALATLDKHNATKQKHPLLTYYLTKPPSGSPPDRNFEITCEKNIDSVQQPSAISCNDSLPQHQYPSPTVKAIADSACDSSTPQVSELVGAASQQEPAEDEPTSTVPETETAVQDDYTVPSDLSFSWDDGTLSSLLDKDSDGRPSVGENTENTIHTDPERAVQPSASQAVVEPKAKSSENKLRCFEDMASFIDQYLMDSTRLKNESTEQEEEEVTDSIRPALHPVKRETTSDWRDGAPTTETFRGTDASRRNSGVCSGHAADCEAHSFAKEDADCKSSHWQPRVSLFRLPIATPRPGRALPRFLLLPGHADDQIHLRQIDEDEQSSVGDLEYLEPLFSPETPGLLQDVTCCVCRCVGSCVMCDACGRGFHRDCHIPAVRSSDWTAWNCSLCQDLSDPSDPYGPDRHKTSCLSLLNQRKCEHLLLFLLCEDSAHVCSPAQVSAISERLSLLRSPPFRTPAEFVSDIWCLFDAASQDSEVLIRLRRRFQSRLVETLGVELHPSLLQHGMLGWADEPAGSEVGTDEEGGWTETSQDGSSASRQGLSEEEEEEEEEGGGVMSAARCRPFAAGRGCWSQETQLRETRRRLRDFLDSRKT